MVPSSLDDLAGRTFFDHPWPSDLRKDPDGSVHFAGFYDPHETVLIADYLKSAQGMLKGFSPVAATYFRFTANIDPQSLPPSPKDTLDPRASVQIVDCDPSSPERGTRRLLQTSWRQSEGVYWLEKTPAVMPALGAPLRPKTRYAVVVTRAVRSLGGAPVAPSADLEEVLGTRAATPRTEAARVLFGPALDELAGAGIMRSDIAHLSVITTDDPTAELFAIADSIRTDVPAPTVKGGTWIQKERASDYDAYEGSYGPSPNYQSGQLPFSKIADGGAFARDAQGKPTLQGTFDLRFSLVVPNEAKCPPPAAGYPIVLYAHGTGGDYRSMIADGTSAALASKCLASMGIDQIFHGTRPGAPPSGSSNREGNIQLLYFNVNNIAAARTNGRQAAVDVMQQARLWSESHTRVPAQISRTGAEIAFDGTRLMFFGHSQGGLNGPLYLAADSSARGGVLSGAGSVISIALMEKTKPEPSVAQLVKTFLQLITDEERDELTIFHPVMSFAQALVDTVDPVNYDGYIILHPRPGALPKSIYETEGIDPDGIGDSYAPPHGIEVGALAMGLPRMAPGVRPIEEASFLGLADVTIPAGGLSGNLAGGKASGVLAQWTPPRSVDGHYVVFKVPQARAQAAGFLRNLADDPTGRVPAP